MIKTKQKTEKSPGAEAVSQSTKLAGDAVQFAQETEGGARSGGFMRGKKEERKEEE